MSYTISCSPSQVGSCSDRGLIPHRAARCAHTRAGGMPPSYAYYSVLAALHIHKAHLWGGGYFFKLKLNVLNAEWKLVLTLGRSFSALNIEYISSYHYVAFIKICGSIKSALLTHWHYINPLLFSIHIAMNCTTFSCGFLL